jgi:hypothetical protein
MLLPEKITSERTGIHHLHRSLSQYVREEVLAIHPRHALAISPIGVPKSVFQISRLNCAALTSTLTLPRLAPLRLAMTS